MACSCVRKKHAKNTTSVARLKDEPFVQSIGGRGDQVSRTGVRELICSGVRPGTFLWVALLLQYISTLYRSGYTCAYTVGLLLV